MTTTKAQICIRRDTSANFTSANPTLALGEIAIETDTRRFKVGDGTTGWTTLAYSAQNPNSMTVTDSTASTSTTTGALVVTGGVGIGGAVNVGGALSVTGTVTVPDQTVAYAKIQNVSATDRILGRSSAGAGVIQEITCTSAGRDLLDDANAAAQRTTLGAAADADVVKLTGTQTVAGDKTLSGNTSFANYTEGVVAIGTVGASHTFALTNGTVQTATLTSGTACTFTMPTATAGKSFVVPLRQPASGSTTTATFTGVKWSGGTAPTITATLGRLDVISFFADGTNWYGSFIQNFTP